MMDTNRKFVFYLPTWDYYKLPYSDLAKTKDVNAFWSLSPNNKAFALLWKVHHSEKIRRKINLPFKNLWFSSYKAKITFSENARIVFVFFSYYLVFDYVKSYIKYLKRHYPNSVFVCYYGDVISKKPSLFSPHKLSSLFDYFITYDENEAQSYGIYYFPTTFSDLSIPHSPIIDYSDVYFLGAMKSGRWEKVLDIYYQLVNKGFTCDFNIVGLEPSKRINLPGLNYLKGMSYFENLQHVMKTKCILEIEQKNASGATLRTWEAIHFGKALITDNKSFIHTPFFDNRYVSLINDESCIDSEFISNYSESNNPLRERIRPTEFIKFIDKIL